MTLHLKVYCKHRFMNISSFLVFKNKNLFSENLYFVLSTILPTFKFEKSFTMLHFFVHLNDLSTSKDYLFGALTR